MLRTGGRPLNLAEAGIPRDRCSYVHRTSAHSTVTLALLILLCLQLKRKHLLILLHLLLLLLLIQLILQVLSRQWSHFVHLDFSTAVVQLKQNPFCEFSSGLQLRITLQRNDSVILLHLLLLELQCLQKLLLLQLLLLLLQLLLELLLLVRVVELLERIH